MRKISFLVVPAVASILGFAHEARAEILFQDGYTVSSGGDVNNQYNAAGRQTGTIAPLTYGIQGDYYGSWDQTGNPPGSGVLLLAASRNGNGIGTDNQPYDQGAPQQCAVTVQHDFGANAGAVGTYQYASADITPPSGPNWTSLFIGTFQASVNPNGVSAELLTDPSATGVRLRGDGTYQFYVKGTLAGSGSFTGASANVQLRATDLVDGNAFNGGSDPVQLALYINGVLASSTLTTDFAAEYVSLQSFDTQGGGPNVTPRIGFVDNLTVGTAAVPEPATLGLIAAGGLVALRRRRAR